MKTEQFPNGTHVTFHDASVTISNACGSVTISTEVLLKIVDRWNEPQQVVSR